MVRISDKVDKLDTLNRLNLLNKLVNKNFYFLLKATDHAGSGVYRLAWVKGQQVGK